MKCTLIRVTNVGAIKNVQVTPGQKALVKIAGLNKSGKTSLIRSFSMVMGGGKEDPEEPVRRGQKKGEILVKLEGELEGELEITKKYRVKGGKTTSTLEIRNADGKVSSPQTMLDKIVGKRMLDPLKLLRLGDKQLREMLIGCVNLSINLVEHAKARKTAYQNRANSNRDVKRLMVELDAAPDPGELPEHASPDDLLEKLEKLTEQDTAITHAKHAVEDMRKEVGGKKKAVEQAEQLLQQEEAELKHIIEVHEIALRDQKVAIEDAKERIGVRQKAYTDFVKEGKKAAAASKELAQTDLSEEIEGTKVAIREATAANAERAKLNAQKAAHARLSDALETAEAEADGYNTEIEELDAAKISALAAANMPIEGLDIDEERVLYNDIPLSQASGAERLQVSLALSAALSPHLEDIWAEDGSLLDEDSLKQVEQFAKDKGLTIWLERVGESDEDCIIIEEGNVKV